MNEPEIASAHAGTPAFQARLPLIAVLVGSALATALLAVFVRDHLFTLYDDAYIYLRYTKNLAAGCGLRFNCDDAPVEGFSSPLYLALLAVGSLFTTRLLMLTQIIGALALAATMTAAVIAAAGPAFGPTPLPARAALALAVAALLGLDHYVLVNAVIGLETSVSALVVTLAWLAVLHDRRRLACVLALLAFLTRPEGLLLVALLPMLPWARRPRVIAGLVTAVAAITLARWLVFHDVVPNTYWAKAGGTRRHVELGAEYLALLFKDHFPFIALAPLALLARPARGAAAYALAVATVWLAFFLRTGGDVFPFGRLAFPLVPVLTVLAARGVFEMALCVATALHATAARATMIAGVVLTLLAGGAAARASIAHGLAPVHGDEKVLRWTALGRYLHANRPGATLATVPIGAIAYYSELHVLDLLGLTTPAIAKAGRTIPAELLTHDWIGHERHNLEWVLAQKPDLLVTTKFRATPWTRLDEARAGFYAEWLFVRAVKEGRAPYHVADAEVAPGVHWLLLERDGRE